MLDSKKRKSPFFSRFQSPIRHCFLTLFSTLLCFVSAPSHAETRAAVIVLGDDFFIIPIVRADPPTTVNSSADSENGAVITWSSNSDADYYELEWYNPDTGQWEVIYSGPATSFNVANLPYGNHQFRVKSCKGSRCGSASVVTTVAITLTGDTGSNSVGALQGDGGVSGGAASYTIPIVVPPGRKGVQPSVSLAYSSRSGNGIAGMGWSLNAGSSIHRCSATVAQDGFTAAVQYSSSRDRLCLNGQRLMKVSGTYGASGAEYRTELDQFARIKQSGAINGGSTSFTVEYKNGLISDFGNSTATRHKDAGRSQIMTWAIARSTDRSGNSLHYDYSNDGEGEYLLNAIHYTGTHTTAGNRHVRFSYEARPNPSSRFLAGGQRRQTKRLKRIKTQYGSQTVRTYSLSYGAVSASSGRSLLRGVQECAYKGSSVHCLPSTTFDWQERSPQFTFERLQFKNSNSSSSVVHADKRWIEDVLPRGDVNGDGVRDWPGYYVNAEGERTGTHNNPISNCYRRANSWTINCLEADFDSDGRTDSFRRGQGTLNVKHANSNTWITTNITWPSSAHSYPIGFSDFNGDGWVDVAFWEANFASAAKLYIYTHTKNKHVPYVTANKTLVATVPFHSSSNGQGYIREYQIHGDVDGNGYADFIEFDTGISSGSNRPNGLPFPLSIKKVTASGGNISFSSLNFTGHIANQSVNANFFHDVNGDGLADWLAMKNVSGDIQYKLNNGNGFASTWRDLGLNLPTRHGIYYPNNPSEPEPYFYPVMSKVLSMDYNGDGRQDVLVAGNVRASSCTFVQQVAPLPSRWLCDDALYGTYRNSQFSNYGEEINGAISDNSARNYQALKFVENANGTIRVVTQTTNITASASQAAVIDATGDGLPDVVTVFGCRFTSGCQWNSQTSGQPNTVQNGGIVAGAYINRNRGAAGSGRYEAIDLMKSVETGLDVKNEWVYRPLSSDQYDRSNSDFYQTTHSAQQNDYDYFHFASSMLVVAEHKASNGVGALNATKYRYRGAIYNNKGRGFQGFKTIITERDAYGSDSNNIDTVSRTDYYQKWPLSGISTQSCTWLANDNKADDNPSCGGVLSKNTTTSVQNVATSGGARFVSPKNTTERRYKLSNRSLLGTTTTTRSFDSVGNITNTTQVYQDAYGKNTQQTTDTFSISNSSWWLNRLTRRVVRHNAVQNRASSSPSIASGTDSTKQVTTNYTAYNSTHRLPSSVTITANDSSLNSTVTTQYTSKGLPKLVTTAGTSVVGPRTITTTYSKDGTSTNDDGYFVRSIKNALNHTSRLTTDPKIGQVLTQTDINGLTSTNTYDAFGRIESVNAAGVPIANTRYRWCIAHCPSNAEYKVTTVQSGSPDSVLYKDQFNRDVLVGSRAFSPRKHNYVKTKYNRLGQTTFESIPYSGTSGAANSNTGTHYNRYDALGRLKQKSVDQAAGWPFITNYAYDGFKTNISATSDRVVNGVRVPTTLNLHRITNGLDQLMETKDANNGYTRYAYDGAGNPIVMQDANNKKITAKFNALGHKTWVIDLNMGRKDFTYNALGEVLSEKDANNDTLSYTYDKLGRMTERQQNGILNGMWVFDNTASNKGLGLLDYEQNSQSTTSNRRFLKSYEYSAASTGRKVPIKVTHRFYKVRIATPSGSNTTTSNASTQNSLPAGGSFDDYAVLSSYDATYGRLKSLTYPTGLTIKYGYNRHGYVTQEKNATTNKVYRQVTAMDARNLITSSKLANGQLSETTNYASQTGQMRSIRVRKGGATQHSLDYLYDGFGNLHFRKTTHGNDRAEESFEYDKLHRVTKSTRHYIPAVVIGPNPDETITTTYDAVGNLTSKSDYASSYAYSGSQPNAVSQVTLVGGGTVNFVYDNNGNMTTGHGKVLRYNVFNKPFHISIGNKNNQFEYGADTLRYKKRERTLLPGIGTTSTTLYIGKLMEIITTKDGTVKSKAYIGGTAVETRTKVGSSASTTQTHYLLKGRLGSTITITDQSGNLVETNSYDAFGKPRLGTWKNKAPATLNSQVTTRGYTGHEHLDESQLIHMNGRAYDYNLGRFLSVDPYIQEPSNSQSMNPYSYLMNNPLAGTDPTGYKGVPEDQEEYKVEDTKISVTGTRLKIAGKKISGGNLTSSVSVGSQRQASKMGFSVADGNGASSNQQPGKTGGVVAGNDSVSGVESEQNQKNKPNALESFAGSTKILVNNFKPIVRRTFSLFKDQIPAGGIALDVTGLEAGFEVGFSAQEGSYTGAAIAGTGVVLGKFKALEKAGRKLYHYTDKAGAEAIRKSGVIKPDSRGRVFLTNEKISSQNTSNALFMGRGGTKGTHRVEVKLEKGSNLAAGTQPNELIHAGSIRNGKHGNLKVKNNDF